MLVVVGFADAVRDGPQNEADITNFAERGVNHTPPPFTQRRPNGHRGRKWAHVGHLRKPRLPGAQYSPTPTPPRPGGP